MTLKNGKFKFVSVRTSDLDVAIILDRAQLIKQFQQQCNSRYGIPSTRFYPQNGIPDPIILGIKNAASDHPKLKLFYPDFGPLSTVSNSIDSLVVVKCLEDNKNTNDSLDIDILFFNRLYKDNILMHSRSQKSTQDKPSLMAVSSVYQHLLCASLINALSDLTKRKEFQYDNIKKDANCIQTLTKAFAIDVFDISKPELLNNLKQYSTFVQEIPRRYPFLRKVLSDYRCNVLCRLINNASTMVRASRRQIIFFQLQYVMSQQSISEQIGITTTQVRHLARLFHDLGLIEVIEKENYNKGIIRSRVKYKLPMVLSIPWFDEAFLQKAEYMAKKFVSEEKTIIGSGNIDTENDKRYLGLETCVISLLDKKPYVTKDDLIKAIELNDLCEKGKSGKYVVEKYFPEIVKRLKLCKAHFSKGIQEYLSQLGYHPKLTYGVSTLFFREDLLNARDNQINS